MFKLCINCSETITVNLHLQGHPVIYAWCVWMCNKQLQLSECCPLGSFCYCHSIVLFSNTVVQRPECTMMALGYCLLHAAIGYTDFVFFIIGYCSSRNRFKDSDTTEKLVLQ